MDKALKMTKYSIAKAPDYSNPEDELQKFNLKSLKIGSETDLKNDHEERLNKSKL